MLSFSVSWGDTWISENLIRWMHIFLRDFITWFWEEHIVWSSQEVFQLLVSCGPRTCGDPVSESTASIPISSSLICLSRAPAHNTYTALCHSAGPPLENLFDGLLARPLRDRGVGKVNSPLRLKEYPQVPIQMVIKKLFNPLRRFTGVTPQSPGIRRCPTQAASGQCWGPECGSLHPDRGRERPKKRPLRHSLDQLALITSGRGRLAPATAGDGGALKSCHSLGRPNLNRSRRSVTDDPSF